jgi:hypothetical protein
LQDRQGKTGRLAGAGLRTGEQIAASQHFGDRAGLHGRRCFVTAVRDGAQQFGFQPERLK